MKSLKICEIKNFMSELLVKNTFDDFLLVDLEINTANKYNISGRINKKWYTDEELEQLTDKEYIKWNNTKEMAYSIIKGNKTPLSMKIVMGISTTSIEQFITNNGLTYRTEEIGGMYLNIKYENNELYMVTGVSFKNFNLDKTLENTWDEYIIKFLKEHAIAAICE